MKMRIVLLCALLMSLAVAAASQTPQSVASNKQLLIGKNPSEPTALIVTKGEQRPEIIFKVTVKGTEITEVNIFVRTNGSPVTGRTSSESDLAMGQKVRDLSLRYAGQNKTKTRVGPDLKVEGEIFSYLLDQAKKLRMVK